MSLLLVVPTRGESAYRHAVETFEKMYFSVTGKTILCAENDDLKENNEDQELIYLGNDSVNQALAKRMLTGEISDFGLRYGTDDFIVKSITLKDGKNAVVLAGGRGRSTIYAVYAYFEQAAGCRYFWDGDVIPARAELSVAGFDVSNRTISH